MYDLKRFEKCIYHENTATSEDVSSFFKDGSSSSQVVPPEVASSSDMYSFLCSLPQFSSGILSSMTEKKEEMETGYSSTFV